MARAPFPARINSFKALRRHFQPTCSGPPGARTCLSSPRSAGGEWRRGRHFLPQIEAFHKLAEPFPVRLHPASPGGNLPPQSSAGEGDRPDVHSPPALPHASKPGAGSGAPPNQQTTASPGWQEIVGSFRGMVNGFPGATRARRFATLALPRVDRLLFQTAAPARPGPCDSPQSRGRRSRSPSSPRWRARGRRLCRR